MNGMCLDQSDVAVNPGAFIPPPLKGVSIYFNGQEHGFKVFQTVVDRLHRRYDHLIWMKLSEIAKYWAAKVQS